MNWLHWIGKSYYTMNSFKREAVQYGVTRRVSLQIAKQMNWGDKVYCAMLNGKTGQIFGYFIVDKLSGLSTEVTAQLKESHNIELVDDGGLVVGRECGEYVTGVTYSVPGDISEIIKTIEEIKTNGRDAGQPMVGGTFCELDPIRLTDIPFRQGFRAIDAKALLHSASANGGRVQGQFYIPSDKAQPLLSDHLKEIGWVQAVENYQKKK